MRKALNFLLGAALLLALAFSLQAQWPPAGTQIGKTTLSSAVTSTNATTVNLATLSITAGPYTTLTFQNPQWGLYIYGEIMRGVSPTPLRTLFNLQPWQSTKPPTLP